MTNKVIINNIAYKSIIKYQYYTNTTIVKTEKWFINKNKPWEDDGDTLHRDNGPAVILYNKSGTILSTSMYDFGKLHAENKPAYVLYNEQAEPILTKWYRNGLLYRYGGPACIETYNVDQFGNKDNTGNKDTNNKGNKDTNNTGVYKCTRETWYEYGVLHRENGPAVTETITHLSTLYTLVSMYYIHGKLHRKDGPAITQWYINFSPTYDLPTTYVRKMYAWYYSGQLHRVADKPALAQFDNSGVYQTVSWYIFNELHRRNGPAYCTNVNGYRSEAWYQYGKLHRKGYPAKQEMDKFNRVTKQVWFVRGTVHRDDGPAHEWWDYPNDHCPNLEGIYGKNYFLNGEYHK